MFINWFKNNWLVCAATLLVALFTGLPSVVFLNKIDEFREVYPVFNSDALYYQARVQEISDGHRDLNNPYFYEHKDISYPQASGAEYFVYGLTRLGGLKAFQLQIIFDFLFPALIFVLTYLLFQKFYRNKYVSVVLPLLLYTVVMGGIFKPINPQVTLPLLLLFLIFWVNLIINQKRKWFNAILAGLFWGLLFLTYFYHWSFLVVLVGIYLVSVLMRKSYTELKYHGVVIGIAGLVGLPYFWRIFASLNAPFHNETAVRVGTYFSHLPESYPRAVVALVWLGFFILLARYYKIEQSRKTQIAAALLIANFLYPNHQLITGIIIENAVHWSWMPILIFFLCGHYLIGIIRKQSNKNYYYKIILSVALILLFLPAWRLHSFTWNPYLDRYKSGVTENRQYYDDIFNWLDFNTKKDSVVLSHSYLMRFIPVYTANNVYNTEYAYNLPSSDNEVIERYLLSHFFDEGFFDNQNFGLDDAQRILWTFPYESEKNTHNIFGGLKIPYQSKYSFEQEIKRVRRAYVNLLKEGWGLELLKKYKIDYIIWDKLESPDWNIEQYGQLEKINEFKDVAIYKI